MLLEYFKRKTARKIYVLIKQEENWRVRNKEIRVNYKSQTL
jgi:hypothetical protein